MIRLSAIAAGFVLALTSSGVLAAPTPLVSVDWLKRHLGAEDMLVVDLRPAGDFEAGHIPDAVNGAYPTLWRDSDWRFLSVDELAENLSVLGIGDRTDVILVPAGLDATEIGSATSAYWMLKYLGHDDVSILDGGWHAWTADRMAPVASGKSAPAVANFTPKPRPEIRATTEQVAARLGTGTVLIDARSPDHYIGKSKSGLVSRAGHIPGAINFPFTRVFNDELRRLKDPDAVTSLLPQAIANPDTDIIAYCNTGHWSSIQWFVLSELLNYPRVRLYDGSMAAWTTDPSRPVETGMPGGG